MYIELNKIIIISNRPEFNSLFQRTMQQQQLAEYLYTTYIHTYVNLNKRLANCPKVGVGGNSTTDPLYYNVHLLMIIRCLSQPTKRKNKNSCNLSIIYAIYKCFKETTYIHIYTYVCIYRHYVRQMLSVKLYIRRQSNCM